MILLPNDGDDISHNDALPVDYKDGKPHVYYNGEWLEIYAHVHTQPDNADPGDADDADWDFISDFGNDITGFILGPNETYRYQDDGTRITQKIPDVGALLGCSKGLSDYYY